MELQSWNFHLDLRVYTLIFTFLASVGEVGSFFIVVDHCMQEMGNSHGDLHDLHGYGV